MASRSNSRHRHRRPIPTASTSPVSRATSHGGRRRCRSRCALRWPRHAGPMDPMRGRSPSSKRSCSCRWWSRAGARSMRCLPGMRDRWGWAGEPAPATSARRCAASLPTGGRRAVIVRCGDPWPYLEPAGTRAAQRSARLAALLAPDASPMDRRAGSASPTCRACPRWRCCACLTCPISAPPSWRWSTSPSSRRLPRSLRRVLRQHRCGGGRGCRLRDLAPPRADHAGFIAWRDALGSAARASPAGTARSCCWRRCRCRCPARAMPTTGRRRISMPTSRTPACSPHPTAAMAAAPRQVLSCSSPGRG